MPRPLLLLILLALAAGGVVLATWSGDPPEGPEDPNGGAPPKSRETDPGTLTGDGQRTQIQNDNDRRTGAGQGTGPAAARRLAQPVELSFRLIEEVNRRRIERADYKLFDGKEPLRDITDQVAPVKVSFDLAGDYTLLFRSRGFADTSHKIKVDRTTRAGQVDVLMKRTEGTARILARDKVSYQSVKDFELRIFRKRDKQLLRTATTTTGDLVVAVPLDEALSLQVETNGYQPSEAQTARLTAMDPKRELTFLLTQTEKYSGIELRVIDDRLRPVKKIVVLAEQQLTNGKYREVFNRQTGRPNGIYRLPELKPGKYRLTARPAPEEGKLSMLVPVTKTVDFTGGEHFILEMQLKLGGRIHLTVRDAAGKITGKGVKLTLTTLAGDQVRTVWEHLDGAGKPFAFDGLAANGLIQDAPARLLEPMLAGQYRLRVQRGNQPQQEVPVTLEAGATRQLRVQLK